MNPCGRAVDWIQFPFEVDARLHRGEGAPLVRLRWVYTDQKFLPLGTPNVITNRIWDEDQVTDLAVGQVQIDIANFEQDARWELPAVLVPGHMCHPEWFGVGEPWPTTLPPTEYSPTWIPTCCGLYVDETEGGIELGGEAEPPIAGGLTCETAVEIATGVTHSLIGPPAGVVWWYKFTIPFFMSTEVDCQYVLVGADFGWVIQTGCAPLEVVYVSTGFPGTFVLPVNGEIRLAVGGTAANKPFTFRADAVPIP
jgi:hypothetical protein